MTAKLGQWVIIFAGVLFLWAPLYAQQPDGEETAGTAATSSAGLCYDPAFGQTLMNALEGGATPLATRLGLRIDSYRVDRRTVRIMLAGGDGTAKAIILHAPNAPGAKLDVDWPDGLPATSQQQLISAISTLQAGLVACATETIPPPQRIHFWSLFSYGLALLMLVLLLAAMPILRKRFTRVDAPLLPLLILGTAVSFSFAEATAGDINLRLYHLHDQYAWNIYGPGGAAFQQIVFHLFGEDMGALLYAHRIFGLLIAIPLYLFVRDRFSSRVGALASVSLLLLHPLWLHYAATELTHAVSLFYFALALSLAVGPHVGGWRLIAALSSLCVAVLGRGEFVLLLPAFIVLLGWDSIREHWRCNRRALLAGILVCALLLVPHLANMAVFVLSSEEGFTVYPDTSSMWAAAVLLHPGNVVANFDWSPWPFAAAVAIGALLMLRRYPMTAIGIPVISLGLFWDVFVLQDAFFVTHYQVLFLPLYAIFGGYGVGCIAGWLVPVLAAPARLAIAIGLLGLLCYIGLMSRESYHVILRGDYTYMSQFKAISAHANRSNFDCTLVYFRPNSDHDMALQAVANFPIEYAERRNLMYESFPSSPKGGCVQYMRTPSCRLDGRKLKPTPMDFAGLCAGIEKEMTLVPIWETTIPARPAFGESYMQSELPIGLFDVTYYRGERVGDVR